MKDLPLGEYSDDTHTSVGIYWIESGKVTVSILADIYSLYLGAKGDWDFRISDLVKNPDGNDI